MVGLKIAQQELMKTFFKFKKVLTDVEKFSIQQAAANLNNGSQPGNNSFKSECVSPRFITEMLSLCDNSVGPIKILNGMEYRFLISEDRNRLVFPKVNISEKPESNCREEH